MGSRYCDTSLCQRGIKGQEESLKQIFDMMRWDRGQGSDGGSGDGDGRRK